MSKTKTSDASVELIWRYFDRPASQHEDSTHEPEIPAFVSLLRDSRESVIRKESPPDRYWNTFVPRLRSRMETRRFQRRLRLARIRYALPMAAVVLLLTLLSVEVFVTTPRIDYLVEQADWIRNLNPAEDPQLVLRSDDPSVDNTLEETVFQNRVTVDEVNVSVGLSEIGYDLSSLTADEQNLVLNTLEQSGVF